MKPYQLIFFCMLNSFCIPEYFLTQWLIFFVDFLWMSVLLYCIVYSFYNAYFCNFRYFCLLFEVQQTDLTFLEADGVL